MNRAIATWAAGNVSSIATACAAAAFTLAMASLAGRGMYHVPSAFDLSPYGNGVIVFSELLLEDPSFADLVRSTLPNDPPAPDLMARVNSFQSAKRPTGDALTIRGDVLNIGAASSGIPSSIRLYLSNDNALDGGDSLLGTVNFGALDANQKIPFDFKLTNLASINQKFAILVLDQTSSVNESDEQNNIEFQRIRTPN